MSNKAVPRVEYVILKYSNADLNTSGSADTLEDALMKLFECESENPADKFLLTVDYIDEKSQEFLDFLDAGGKISLINPEEEEQ